jgi:hypothetical protein
MIWNIHHNWSVLAYLTIFSSSKIYYMAKRVQDIYNSFSYFFPTHANCCSYSLFIAENVQSINRKEWLCLIVWNVKNSSSTAMRLYSGYYFTFWLLLLLLTEIKCISLCWSILERPPCSIENRFANDKDNCSCLLIFLPSCQKITCRLLRIVLCIMASGNNIPWFADIILLWVKLVNMWIMYGNLNIILCYKWFVIIYSNRKTAIKSLNIFRQNIRGLRKKCDELIYSLEIDGMYPHILCLSQHHMVEQDLLHLTLAGYLLGPSFCRLNLQRGCVCIFVRNDQCFNKIDISHHCKEQGLEIYAIQLVTKTCNLIVITLYRAPLGDFNQSLKRLNTTLKYLCNPDSEFLICGDISIDYLNESNQEKQINSLLTTYNLTHTRCKFCNKNTKWLKYSNR